MSEIWFVEKCPSCGSNNWIYDHDDGLFDVESYTCWKCQAEIKLVDGEFGDEHRPHKKGESEWDDLSGGRHEDGKEKPC